ncbi:putative disease resistance protein [Vitis vinifera]|uniref:Putative disease resistance protein n=1 Tax=Vitis vinifera TaxID=29760 RepID=A0A438HRQ6_VITVI|nr:putative disease resistance protein [Vitis vinifera]
MGENSLSKIIHCYPLKVLYSISSPSGPLERQLPSRTSQEKRKLVEAVVALAVEKLGGLLIEEFGYAVRRTHVQSEVEWIERELIRINCFLKDADAKQKGDERVKTWVRDVRDVAYQVEDAIDTFIMIKSTGPRKRAGFIKRCVCCFSFLLNELALQHKLGKDIRGIKVKISDISASRITYGIENIGGGGEGSSYVSEKLRERRRSCPRMDDHDVIGFDEDINMLVARLLDQETPRRSTISIVGMGGLGKTTLAKKVYNCRSVKRRFDFCAWVYVSQDYRAGELLHEIGEKILRIEKGRLAMMNRQHLEERVSTVLRKKRYLIVLDDIWETEVWDDLKTLFPDLMNASRVLFTTRIRDVAIHADPRSATHELHFLNQAQSWELFLKKAFPMEGDSVTCPPELERLGTQIVAKCGGLPLAIVIIGGLLSRKRKYPVYNDLPYYLKPCFLYFGLFPEDLEIPVGKLVLLWIAEGFVQQRGEESMEDVAEDFLEELVDRSMIQVAEKRYNGKIKMCRIHDLLRDLAMSEAKECKFLEILDSTNIDTSVTTRARRISVHSSLEEYMKLRHPNPHFRSMLHFSRCEESLRREQWKSLFESLKLLRVLDLERVQTHALPKEIRELVHLRYLGLRRTGLQRLPSSVQNFCNLQTLDIRATKTLSTVSIYGNQWIPDLLGKLTNLRKLGIHGYFASQTEALSRCLVKLSNLQNLQLRGTELILEPTIKLLLNQPNIHKLHLSGPIEKLPDPQEIQPNLTKIILEKSLLVQDIFVILGKLPNLQMLKLLINSFFGKEITCSASGFPKLHGLELSELVNLEEWRVDDGAMPSLRHLVIDHCDQLKKIPEGFQYLTALRELFLLNMPDEFEIRIKGDDWYKIQHIPSIVMR